jgi:hypothetical protein
MTCSECQLQIFDGELDRSAVAHLTECEACRELDCEVRLNSFALAEFRDEPLPAERRPRRWWPMVVAAAAAAIAFMIISHEEPQLPPPPASPVAKLTPPDPAFPAAPAPVRRHRPVRKPQPKPQPAPEQPLLVKFITEDPDVVVYWIVDPNQGEPGL